MLAFFGAVLFRDHVRAVERVVETSPAGIGGVQSIAGVVERHHQLRPGDGGDLGVDVGRGDFEFFSLGDEITDLLQKGGVYLEVKRLTGAGQVPLIDLLLQPVTLGQERAILRPEISHDRAERFPKAVGLHAGSRRDLVAHQTIEPFIDFKTADLDSAGHDHLRFACTRGKHRSSWREAKILSALG